mgnify:CR=1 FL=1
MAGADGSRDDPDAWLRAALALAAPPSSDYDLNPDIKLAAGRKLRPAAVLVAVAPSAPERMPATASDEGADTMSATQSPPGRASENYSTKKRAAWRSNRSLT